MRLRFILVHVIELKLVLLIYVHVGREVLDFLPNLDRLPVAHFLHFEDAHLPVLGGERFLEFFQLEIEILEG